MLFSRAFMDSSRLRSFVRKSCRSTTDSRLVRLDSCAITAAICAPSSWLLYSLDATTTRAFDSYLSGIRRMTRNVEIIIMLITKKRTVLRRQITVMTSEGFSGLTISRPPKTSLGLRPPNNTTLHTQNPGLLPERKACSPSSSHRCTGSRVVLGTPAHQEPDSCGY